MDVRFKRAALVNLDLAHRECEVVVLLRVQDLSFGKTEKGTRRLDLHRFCATFGSKDNEVKLKT